MEYVLLTLFVMLNCTMAKSLIKYEPADKHCYTYGKEYYYE
jgi:hypothetical protein